MDTAYRFFRKYFISTILILFLFLFINTVLIVGVLLLAKSNSGNADIPIETVSNHITKDDNEMIIADETVRQILDQKKAWAMLLNDFGAVIWRYNVPDNIPTQFTSADIAKFSRWYLKGYPAYVYEHSAGLLVICGAPNSIVKWNFSMDSKYISLLLSGSVFIITANIFLILLLFWRNTRRVEKAIAPILEGIENISDGKAVSLPEKGELAEINYKLNRAGKHLLKKEQSRAEWINGISHDVRTPLSIMLGYAGEIEENIDIPEEVRAQAGIIRQQGIKLRQLITDLNLVSKLEYSMQPLHISTIYLVELARQIIVEYMEQGLDLKYSFELQTDNYDMPVIRGDLSLISRMFENLLQNSIKHNPDGCHIDIIIKSDDVKCLVTVSDDGVGIDEIKLNQFNLGTFSVQTYEFNGEAAHGLGLRLVYQIVKAHKGTVRFLNRKPHGLSVTVELPKN